MILLACDTSNSTCCAGVYENTRPIAFELSNDPRTHSETFMPLVNRVMEQSGYTFDTIDFFAVTTGPGSFTGLRIGIASAKGLAEPKNLICVGVSTLLAAAYMFLGENAVICPVIDARCGQVYNALIKVEGDTVTRLCEDRAILINDLVGELKSTDGKIILCGDAAQAVFSAAHGIKNVMKAPLSARLPSAVGVALYAAHAIETGEYTDAAGLMPVYLKLPQAERELREKKGENI